MALGRVWTASSPFRANYFILRKCSSTASDNVKKGTVFGVYTGEKDEDVILTSAAKQFDNTTQGSFMKHLHLAGPGLKKGTARIFYNLSPAHEIVAAVGLGKHSLGFNEQEEIEEGKEAVRSAAAVGCRALHEIGVTDISVENLGDAEAAAEGTTLGVWCFQDFKEQKKRKKCPRCRPLEGYSEGWTNGTIVANAQNLARKLSDTPSNFMTPTIFADKAESMLNSHGVKVNTYDKKWIEEQNMGAFLSVAKGSMEKPVFLEMIYSRGRMDQQPLVLIGKGITFDSGGISLKPSNNMDEMRADMGGAACVVATMYAVSQLKLPVNLVGLCPLCENMPSGLAVKPGDIVKARNGKTIQVANTDAEGRLILADALCYANTFNPKFTLDIATLTGAMRIALGGTATGVFTNSSVLWQRIHRAGALTGDRVWRFPLWEAYSKRVTDFPAVDVNNVGKGKGGGACTAAAFLKEFAPKGDWIHLDIAGVMGPLEGPYLQKGMTGRPTRTLVQLVSQFGNE
ncbi:cytosol aminopeptidase-like isoform X2 [Lycorma delicatula]|uniref:cytosol aminopeptidase-like isoform X2 n=1 Tax=Lycorma delicatula TaxID=130591 RepID=UPI003F5131D7